MEGKLATRIGNDRPELIFALVGAAGTRLEDLSKKLKEALETFGSPCCPFGEVVKMIWRACYYRLTRLGAS
jgi:hypothetical protein